MKRCTKCKKHKQLNEFNRDNARKDGLRPSCKECKKKWIEQNRSVVKALSKNWYEKNKDHVNQNSNKWYGQNKQKQKYYSMEYRQKNTKKLSESKRKWYEKNKDKCREKSKTYYKSNREKIVANIKDRRDSDSVFRLRNNISSLIRASIRNGGFRKNTKTMQILGCSFLDFKQYLDMRFIERYGILPEDVLKDFDIHVDHIIPVSSALSEEELISLNHFSNLEYRFACENQSKGAKISDQDPQKFEQPVSLL